MKSRVARSLVAAMIVFSVLVLPSRARADDGLGSDAVKWEKVFDIAACALSIATIETGLGAVSAVISCGRAVSDWWTE